MQGYAGRILHIDLTTGKTNVEPLNEEYAIWKALEVFAGLRAERFELISINSL